MNTANKNNGQHAVLAPGTQAPDFTLRCTPDESVALSQLRGRPVVLAFYPADWSPVCFGCYSGEAVDKRKASIRF
jgi:peroxiredoxin